MWRLTASSGSVTVGGTAAASSSSIIRCSCTSNDNRLSFFSTISGGAHRSATENCREAGRDDDWSQPPECAKAEGNAAGRVGVQEGVGAVAVGTFSRERLPLAARLIMVRLLADTTPNHSAYFLFPVLITMVDSGRGKGQCVCPSDQNYFLIDNKKRRKNRCTTSADCRNPQ